MMPWLEYRKVLSLLPTHPFHLILRSPINIRKRPGLQNKTRRFKNLILKKYIPSAA
jgi:hypothetical protein